MIEVEFQNVTITVQAKDARAAYARLCTLLGRDTTHVEWTTDTYTIEGVTTTPQDTWPLWETGIPAQERTDDQ